MINLESLHRSFCLEYKVDFPLSYEMPAGLEMTYCSYDIAQGVLFLNLPLLNSAPEHERLYYFYHELRHALQHLRPELFSNEVLQSRNYMIYYNGTCRRLADRATWKSCMLRGEESYFLEAYLNMPHEADANRFAYRQVKNLLGDSPDLRGLWAAYSPKTIWDYADLKGLFSKIDQACSLTPAPAHSKA